jgi:iron(III) transport system substrate-binding protein
MAISAPRMIALLASVAAFAAFAAPAQADDVVNIYSSRHYDTDERLYSDFTEATGIEINLIEGKEDELIERMKAEGANSPADVFITADAGRLWRADEAGLFQAVESEVLNERIPDSLRHPDGHWFGISKRARVIFYDKDKVSEPPQTYAALADPKYKGLVCTRTGSNIYMLSLMGAYIAHNGDEAAKTWAQGLKDNLARDPQGGDTDQLKGIVSGECAIAVANTYYFARGVAGQVDGLTEGIDKIGIVFPDQGGNGTHVNISGAGVAANAPNRDNAVKLLEYSPRIRRSPISPTATTSTRWCRRWRPHRWSRAWANSPPTRSTSTSSARTRPAPRKSTTRSATSKPDA